MKIYTKTGDKGKTSLVSGHRVSKSHLRLEVYGTIDELNSHMGFIASHSHTPKYMRNILQALQNKLFDLGSHFANDDKDIREKLPEITENDITFLEHKIDEYVNQLPELKEFILPGGHTLIAQVHIARTVCRRAERLAVELSEATDIPNEHIKYLNRFSDFLFVVARKLALDLTIEEIKWRKNIDYNNL